MMAGMAKDEGGMPNAGGRVFAPALIERARRCVCGRVDPVWDVDADLPGLVVMRCCAALYQHRGMFLSLVKKGCAEADKSVRAPVDAPVMRVLALDVDGVLNAGGPQVGSLIPEQVEMLRCIVERTQCRVVVISYWRHVPAQMERLRAVLRQIDVGYSEAPFQRFGADSFLLSGYSGKALDLQRWLGGRMSLDGGVDAGILVVLDDQPVPGFEAWQIMPAAEVGLTWELVERVCRKLMEDEGRAAQ